jgi:hypothetical protein
VHRIDPTLLELLELIVDRVPTLPILLMITFRPEFTDPAPRSQPERPTTPCCCATELRYLPAYGDKSDSKVLVSAPMATKTTLP